MIYDVAIVGTGPGGGSAALHLAKSGLSCVILESRSLPRSKACGGLFPRGAEKPLELDIQDLIDHEVRNIQYLNNYALPHSATPRREGLVLVDRSVFDAGLISRALEIANGRLSLLTGFHVRSVIESENDVKLIGPAGNAIVARYAIAADGAVSQSARSLGLNPHPQFAVAIDAELEVTPECYQEHSHELLFNYFCIPKGYGWIFPKKPHHLACGIGSLDHTINTKTALKTFLSKSKLTDSIRRYKASGHPIPIYCGRTRIATRRVALAGDAASLVDPVSGEGIQFAFLSGRIAAESVTHLLVNNLQRDNSVGLLAYQSRVELEISPKLDFLQKFISLQMREAPDYFYRTTIQRSGTYLNAAKAL